MANPAMKSPKTPPRAVEQLSAALAEDMRGVNEMILRQLGSTVPLIPQVAQYLIAAGGKRLRPLLTVAAARLTGDKTNHSHALAAAVEFIHTASLLHDDVVDESAQRRGQPSANEAFGNQASVLVGDFLFARAFVFMVSTGNLEILQVLATASTKITEGEVLQMTLAGDVGATEEDYLRVIESKTASLFAAATETGAILGGNAVKQRSDSAKKCHREEMHAFGHNFGMMFQLIDDALDYSADAEKLNKNLGDDFREGKLTLPVILAIRAGDAEEKAFWQRAFAGNCNDEMFATAQSLMQRHHVMPLVRARAESYAAAARAALMQLPDTDLRAMLLGVIDDVLAREG